MANLPSNTFKFNYNAKYYNSTTHTFPKTSGQLFNNDLVLSGSSFPVVYDDYLEFTSNTNACKGFYPDSSFERTDTATGRSLTFIYKTADWGAGSGNLFANRYSDYNYMVRPTVFHTSNGSFLQLSATTSPQICVIRVSSDGYSERKYVDSDGVTINSVTSSTIDYGNAAGGFGFFAGYANRNTELFKGKFYWMYCSFETLTDAEVLQVIKYNEGVDLELSTSALTFTSEASSSTVTVSSNNPWTATTQDDWITLSQSTGNTGETTITVSVSSSIFSNRVGTVSFTDGENMVDLTVNQKKNTSVRLKNLYLDNTRIDKMYCNGDLIYQSLIKPVFSLSTNELEIETGQTGTFDITANDSWTISAPEWLTVSQNSGYGNATITVTMGSVESAGTINVTCYEQTKTISVSTTIDYSKKYLTFDILSDGYINWMYNNNSTIHNTIEYRKNGGSWSAITSTSSGVHIDVVTGDMVEFRGNNATYSSSSARYGMFTNTTCNFSVKGNIMSLINSTNFQTLKTFTESYNFRALFNVCRTLLDASKLVLPATTLATGSYRFMFQDCSSLTKAPELPATTLTNECYYSMFSGCKSLNYIKCLAINRATTDTLSWVSNVSSTGTFVKNASMTGWSTGVNGIPSGWTVEEV